MMRKALPRPAAFLRASTAVLGVLAGCGDATVMEVRGSGGELILEVEVEIADTAEARRLGLSGRDALPPSRGLWLSFPVTGEVCIGNGSVGFSIDAVFAGEDGTIVAVEREIAAGDDVLRCHAETRSVLEVGGGVALGVDVGDVLHGPL